MNKKMNRSLSKEVTIIGYIRGRYNTNDYGFLTVIYERDDGKKLTHTLFTDQKIINSFVVFEKDPQKILPDFVDIPNRNIRVKDISFFVFKNKEEIIYGSFTEKSFSKKMALIAEELPFRYHSLKQSIKKLL